MNPDTFSQLTARERALADQAERNRREVIARQMKPKPMPKTPAPKKSSTLYPTEAAAPASNPAPSAPQAALAALAAAIADTPSGNRLGETPTEQAARSIGLDPWTLLDPVDLAAMLGPDSGAICAALAEAETHQAEFTRLSPVLLMTERGKAKRSGDVKTLDKIEHRNEAARDTMRRMAGERRDQCNALAWQLAAPRLPLIAEAFKAALTAFEAKSKALWEQVGAAWSRSVDPLSTAARERVRLIVHNWTQVEPRNCSPHLQTILAHAAK